MAESNQNGCIVITGSTGGIGACLADHLLSRGHCLVAASRRTTQESLKPNLLEVPYDALSKESVEQVFDSAEKCFGHVIGIAHCVGSMLLKPAHLTGLQEWMDIMQTNLTSAFHVVASAGKRMRSRGGSVVLFSSVAARRGLPNHEAVAAAKAGLEGLTLSAAATYARYGIRFNAVAPGLTDTPMTRIIVNNPRSLDISRSLHPLGRIGDPKDIASAAAWLLSSDQNWVTGQILHVDGGLSTIQAPSRAEPVG